MQIEFSLISLANLVVETKFDTIKSMIFLVIKQHNDKNHQICWHDLRFMRRNHLTSPILFSSPLAFWKGPWVQMVHLVWFWASLFMKTVGPLFNLCFIIHHPDFAVLSMLMPFYSTTLMFLVHCPCWGSVIQPCWCSFVKMAYPCWCSLSMFCSSSSLRNANVDCYSLIAHVDCCYGCSVNVDYYSLIAIPLIPLSCLICLICWLAPIAHVDCWYSIWLLWIWLLPIPPLLVLAFGYWFSSIPLQLSCCCHCYHY